jgi:sugar (pentulose or hexulose) kinase
LTRENLSRAILEGVAHSLRLCLEQFGALGLPAEQLRVVGGAASSPAWQRVLADVLQVPLAISQESETAALGAALQAQWAHTCAGAFADPQAKSAKAAAILAQAIAPHMAAAAHVEPDRTLWNAAADQHAQHRERIAQLYGVHA